MNKRRKPSTQKSKPNGIGQFVKRWFSLDPSASRKGTPLVTPKRLKKRRNEERDTKVARVDRQWEEASEDKLEEHVEIGEQITLQDEQADQMEQTEREPEDKQEEFFEFDGPVALQSEQEEDEPEGFLVTSQQDTLRRDQMEVVRLRREVEHYRQERGILGIQEERAGAVVPFFPPISPRMPTITLGELLATLTDSWRLIAGVILAFLFLGLGYIVISKPVYQADALLDIKQTTTGIDALADISKVFKEVFEQESKVAEEIQILQSRRLLGEVVDDLNLEIIVQPVYFPVIGNAVARINTLIKSVAMPSFDPGIPLIDLEGYAWSNERLKIKTLKIPQSYLGETFTLVAAEKDRFQLFDQEGNLLSEGTVGVPNEKWLPIEKPHALLVSELEAHPGTRFELTKIPLIEAIEQLNQVFAVKEISPGGGVAGGASMVQLTLEGTDRNKITDTVNAIVDTFVKQDIAKKFGEVKNSIDFMEEQKVMLKKQMEAAEEALNNYRLKRGAVDLSKETQILLERMVAMETELSELRRKRAELLQKFTPQHSNIISLDAQISTLTKELGALDGKAKTFPDTQQEVLRLTRDAELYIQLYTFLSNRVEQLKVMGAGPFDTVRVVDRAELPYVPVKPYKALVIVISSAIGLFFGIGAVFLRKALRGSVQDPDVIEKTLGLHVYATVPHTEKQTEVMKEGEETQKAVLAITDPAEPAVESLRSLRTSLHFVLLESKNNVILITGPTPGIGKSFVSVNFGAVLASAGKRVLLFDGDLRKGHLNKYFGMKSEGGLSDAIANGKNIKSVIRKTNIKGLDIICAGTTPPNPSELLSHERLVLAIERLSQKYDYVIIDSPPILLVTDAAILGRQAGATLLVVKAGEHTLREIEHSVKRLKQGGVNLRGVIFNDMPVTNRRYGYGDYYGYAHSYSYYK